MSTRVRGAESLDLPDDVRKGADYLVGSWIGEGTSNGQPATMQLSVRWAHGRQHMLYEWSTLLPDGKTIHGNAVGGLDRARNRWVEYFMESDGAHWTNWWPPLNARTSETEYSGEQLIHHKGPDAKAKTAVRRKSLNEWLYTVAAPDGQSAAILSMTFRRVVRQSSNANAEKAK